MFKQNAEELDEIEIINSKDVKPILKEFIAKYIKNETEPIEKWLIPIMEEKLPNYTKEEIVQMVNEIINSIEVSTNKKIDLEKAVESGVSVQSWFSNDMKKYISTQTNQKTVVGYLENLDKSLYEANKAMYETITTKQSGYSLVSNNPNLDGYIAEQHHVNSFNLNAALKESNLKSEVQGFKPGQTYTKNGFDVIMKDTEINKRIHQYQMKFGATAKDTINMLKAGNYNNQTIIVPEDQVEAVKKAFPNKKILSNIEEGNIKSTSVTKQDVKRIQNEAQNGIIKEENWDSYNFKDLTFGIGKHVAGATLMGATLSSGFEIAKDLFSGEEINKDKVIKNALKSGADCGIKAATAGAIKVAVEKDIIKGFAKGTPIGVFANIAHVGIENIKILSKVADGVLDFSQGINEMAKTTVSTVSGLFTMGMGSQIGTVIGSFLGPVGAVVGNFVGGAVAYIGGSTIGRKVYEGAKKIALGAKKIVSKTWQGVKTVGNAIFDGVTSGLSKVASFFGF